MQEASDALSKTADSSVSTYQVSSVQLVTNKKREAFGPIVKKTKADTKRAVKKYHQLQILKYIYQTQKTIGMLLFVKLLIEFLNL